MSDRSQDVRMPATKLQDEIGMFLGMFGNANTEGTYRRCLKEFVRWFRKDGAFRFREEDVERYKRYLAKTRQLAPVSVSTYLTALRRLCYHLVQGRVLVHNPARNVGGNKRPQRHTRARLSKEDLARLLTTLRAEDELTSRNSTIIRLMVDCGLSESELVRLNAGDFRKRGTSRMLALQRKGQEGKDHYLPMPAEAGLLLERYLAWRKKNYGEVFEPSTPLFLSAGNRTRGSRMSTRGIREIVNNHLTAAGVKKRNVTPLSLRRTAARRMADAGATPEQIRQRMRLGSVKTAMVYLR